MTAAEAALVSIGLPVYNGERFLDAAIRCVLEQDHEHVELIIADNGSTDSTNEICMRWASADDRVRYLRSDENLGAARNFNRAFEASVGTYFKWMAADDEIDATFVSKCLAMLETDADVALAYGQVVDIDERGDVLTEWGPLPRATDKRPGNRVADVILNESRAFPVFGLARREQMARTRLIKPWTGSDYLVLRDLAIQGRFAEIPEPLFRHREHDGRSTRMYVSFRDRAAWFDSRRTHRFSCPRWSNVIGFTLTPLRQWRGARAAVTVTAATTKHAAAQWKMLVRELLLLGRDAGQFVAGRWRSR